MIRFQWIGGPTFLLEAGAFRILTDPMFSEGAAAFVMNGHPSTGEDGAAIARLAPLPPLILEGLDAVVVSHLHSDHFDTEAVRRVPKDTRVLVEATGVERLRGWGFTEVRGLRWWEGETLRKGDETLRILALPARHAHAEELSRELGVVNGYLLEYVGPEGRFTVYWTADTVWFEELEEVRRRVGPVDLLVPHMGAVGVDGPYGRMTLDAAEAVHLIERFRPATVIPIHHHTLSHYVEPVEALAERHATSRAPGRLVVLREGDYWQDASR